MQQTLFYAPPVYATVTVHPDDTGAEHYEFPEGCSIIRPVDYIYNGVGGPFSWERADWTFWRWAAMYAKRPTDTVAFMVRECPYDGTTNLADSWQEANGVLFVASDFTDPRKAAIDICQEWSQVMQNEVYGLVAETVTGEIDSIWGFVGEESARAAAEEIYGVEALEGIVY